MILSQPVTSKNNKKKKFQNAASPSSEKADDNTKNEVRKNNSSEEVTSLNGEHSQQISATSQAKPSLTKKLNTRTPNLLKRQVENSLMGAKKGANLSKGFLLSLQNFLGVSSN